MVKRLSGFKTALRLGPILVAALVIGLACGPAEAPTPTPQAPTAALATPTPAAAPTPTPVPVEKRKVDNVNVAMGALVNTVVGGFEPSLQSRIATLLLYDTVAMQNQKTGAIEPRLASSWEVKADNTVVVRLKKGILFHNGEAFNAPNDISVINYLYQAKTAQLGYQNYTRFQDYTGWKAVDDYTEEFSLKQPSSLWLYPFGFHMPLAAKHLETVGILGYNEKPVGTGAHKFVEWRRDDFLTLERFPNYWGNKPLINRITFRHVPEGAVRIAGLESGQMDIAALLPPEQVPRLLSKGFRVAINEAQQSETVYLDAGRRTEQLKDKRVRQAMLYAVDLPTIWKTIIGGYGTMLQCQSGTPTAFGYNPDLKNYPYDPKKARELLKDAGYPNGFTIKGSTTTGRYFRDKEFMTAVVAYWADVGIKVEMEYPESALWLQLHGQFQQPPIWNIGMNWFLRDTVSQTMMEGYKGDPLFNDMLSKIRFTVDDTVREKLVKEAAAYSCDEAHALFAHTIPGVYGLNPKLPELTFGNAFEMFIPSE